MKKMKNKMLIVGALFVGIFMTSCKKDYTCQCSKTYTTGTGSNTSNYATYTYKDTKPEATDRCNNNETQGSDLFGNYSINCEIK
jgi:hypothetical protein